VAREGNGEICYDISKAIHDLLIDVGGEYRADGMLHITL
jgi:hypothetical protein